MVFGSRRARANFLKYAFTSIDMEHEVPFGYRNEVLADLKNGVPIENIEEDLFLTGVINIEKLYGKRASVKNVDDYFLDKHNKFSNCKAYEGILTKLNRKSARVETLEGSKRYDIFFTNGLNVGDRVIVHGNYVIKVVK